MPEGGAFVISLDFELLWGVRDKRTISDYGRNILGVRRAIPAMLDLFEQRTVACTWATVGFLFCADKSELTASFPRLLPRYCDRRLSPYDDLADLGRDEESDPYRYGLSLLKQIQTRPRQEIATHTFSHFYCLEEGGDVAAFQSDLEAARAVADRRGIALTSIAFPRNQITPGHLRVCRQMGLTAFRGNEPVWFHAARRDDQQTLPMRAFRLADSYLPLAGAQAHRPAVTDGMVDIASSRFLRPARPAGLFERLRLARITSAMASAARSGRAFHLWWHPHNFGVDTENNLAFLAAILDQFGALNHRYGMRSMTMAEVAAEALHGPGGSAHK
jgi:hypothetical protein